MTSQNGLSTFFGKTHSEKFMELVDDFVENSSIKNGKPLKSSNIFRVKTKLEKSSEISLFIFISLHFLLFLNFVPNSSFFYVFSSFLFLFSIIFIIFLHLIFFFFPFLFLFLFWVVTFLSFFF